MDGIGLLSEILTKDNFLLNLRQNYASYNGKTTLSGLYIFNPLLPIDRLENLILKEVMIQEGEIMTCVQTF